MGRTNASKAQQKRERNAAAKKKSNKGSQLKDRAKALDIICSICKASFMSTSNERTLTDHINSKHPNKTRGECFPNWDPEKARKKK